MKITLHPSFTKAFKKRIAHNKKLVTKSSERIELFKIDPTNPLLKDHALKGKKRQFRGFWITGDIRVVYLPVSEEEAIFVDIGSHNQVY